MNDLKISYLFHHAILQKKKKHSYHIVLDCVADSSITHLSVDSFDHSKGLGETVESSQIEIDF